MDWKCSVYVIAGPVGPVKIGRSVCPEKRAKALSRQVKRSLRVVFSMEYDHNISLRVENTAQRLVGSRNVGGEWFDITEGDAIKAVEEAGRIVTSGGHGYHLRALPSKMPRNVRSDDEKARHLSMGRSIYEWKARTGLPWKNAADEIGLTIEETGGKTLPARLYGLAREYATKTKSAWPPSGP